ncbi:MAG: hypothetical protein Q7T71_05650 [Herbiconiux sp.]|nr:hypothetical protein [Herbiconiux sp.]
MLELTELSRLPDSIGDRQVFRHAGASFFITPTSPHTWVVGHDGSGETIAILERDPLCDHHFTLAGPGVAGDGESWMLLLADL